MKLFRFESRETNYEKCGSCNWEATYLYWMSDTRKNARKEIKDLGEDGNALCGSCMCDLLVEKGYEITPGPVNDNCDGGIKTCETAYLYELYWESDRKWYEENNNSCMFSAKIYPSDLIKLMNEYIDKNPDDFNIEGFLDYLDLHGVWNRIIAPDYSFYFGKGTESQSASNKSEGGITTIPRSKGT